jgi:hypothetical protein
LIYKFVKDRTGDQRGGLNGSLKFDPKIEEEKVPIQTPHHSF